jgi:hypothetical protein
VSGNADEWQPRRRVALADLLRNGRIADLTIGAPASQIEATLGPPQAPAAKLSKRSKLWSWQYGNLTVLTADHRVEAIEIDFEGQRPALVELGGLAGWSLADWLAHAQREGWTASSPDAEITILDGPQARVSLDADGQLHVVSLRPRS